MKHITVKRTTLIEKLKERLEQTEKQNDASVEEWRLSAIKRYEAVLKRLKAGETFHISSDYPPTDRKDYRVRELKRAISELEMAVDENLKVPTNSSYLNMLA